ncbi:hypothetical protein Y032_0017g3184 [Ancylostoma ceylanicum]|uniref:Secreted protein n=1 Tax=Ancylostoma ceylanicum TaxID=53326 RepID=A0A016V4H7_9BILA|nr:hypothetical protein Y032_0017g3184 [Ancylostoma ceylanicum]
MSVFLVTLSHCCALLRLLFLPGTVPTIVPGGAQNAVFCCVLSAQAPSSEKDVTLTVVEKRSYCRGSGAQWARRTTQCHTCRMTEQE